MLYNFLKVIHIVSASILLTTTFFCLQSWWKGSVDSSKLIAKKTGLLLMPFAFLQLMTGFTMFSLEKEFLTHSWAKESVVLFMTAVGSWIFFLYLLNLNPKKLLLEKLVLLICLFSTGSLIFLMVNKP